MKNLLVRAAALADAAEIARIHVTTWQAAYRGLFPHAYLDALSVPDRTRFWSEHLALPQHGVLVAELDQAVCGWASCGKTRDSRAEATTAELYAMYVQPTAWNSGLGSALFHVVESKLKTHGFQRLDAMVLKENPSAHRFYEKMGMMWSGRQEMVKIGNIHLVELRFTKQLG